LLDINVTMAQITMENVLQLIKLEVSLGMAQPIVLQATVGGADGKRRRKKVVVHRTGDDDNELPEDDDDYEPDEEVEEEEYDPRPKAQRSKGDGSRATTGVARQAPTVGLPWELRNSHSSTKTRMFVPEAADAVS
jgi:hypothetical protein